MQETSSPARQRTDPGEPTTTQSLIVLLALAGSKKTEVENLKRRMKLSSSGFENMLNWLQKRSLVDVISSLEGTN